MPLLSWDVRMENNPSKDRDIKEVKRMGVSMDILQETKIHKIKKQRVQNMSSTRWSFITNLDCTKL